MAAVTRGRKLEDRVDSYLDYLLARWQANASLPNEWAEWSDQERLEFAIDWTVPEDRLHQLQNLEREGRLTPAQLKRFRQLTALVDQYRPTLDRLFRTVGFEGSRPPRLGRQDDS
jgi:hypothetical protein